MSRHLAKQLVNKAVSGDLRAWKCLFEMMETPEWKSMNETIQQSVDGNSALERIRQRLAQIRARIDASNSQDPDTFAGNFRAELITSREVESRSREFSALPIPTRRDFVGAQCPLGRSRIWPGPPLRRWQTHTAHLMMYRRVSQFEFSPLTPA
jgi:hypothetical protein